MRSAYGPRLMKLTDHESDILATARLGETPPSNPAPVRRESWLDRLARHLGAVPVDHMPIVPRSRPAPACCSTVSRA